jgi:hypothetical protein
VGDLVRFRRGAGVRLNYDVAQEEIGTVCGVESRTSTTGPAYRVEVSFKNALVHYTKEDFFDRVQVVDQRREQQAGQVGVSRRRPSQS